mgnify:CR=1 FL=1
MTTGLFLLSLILSINVDVFQFNQTVIEFNDDGEWVSARFTTASDEIYEEWYYIIDGKLSWWGSAKRGLYTE